MVSGPAESGGARTPAAGAIGWVVAGWIGLELFVGTGKRNVKRMLKIEMEFGRKFLGWREDGENGDAARAQSGFCGYYGGRSIIPSLGWAG